MRVTRVLWPVLSLVFLLVACGPNTFQVRGTVLNPLHDQTKDDPETGRAPQYLVIKRKETRSQQSMHTIVGPHRRPMALNVLGEYCEIDPNLATRGRLVFQCLLYSNYKDELVDMAYAYTLDLPDGRKVPGLLYSKYALRDLSVSITGAHRQPYLVVRDRAQGTVSQYSYIQEVQNDYPLFSREFKLIFEDKDLLDLSTSYVELVIDGYQRRWIYRFDLTEDPEEAMQWWITHME